MNRYSGIPPYLREHTPLRGIFRVFIVLFVFGANHLFAQDTVKIMSYNLLNYPGDVALNREPSYRTILEYAQPDILVVQEMAGGQAGVDTFFNKVITQVLSNFAKGSFIDGYDTDNAIFFRSTKFAFISNTAYATALRDINEFKLVHLASGDTLRIYSVHLKSSPGSGNEVLRAAEVDSLRKVTDKLAAGKSFIVCGDFNIYNSNESAYTKLISTGSNINGKFTDPVSMPFPSNWNNSANAFFHTQSPRIRTFGGGSTGGMDDRFDLMLYSTGLGTTGGTDYLPGSMTVIGNDGNHYNDSINAQPNTAVSVAVANALHYAADHLPVSAKFVFSSSLAALPSAQPTNMHFSNIAQTSMTVSWTAASPTAEGVIVLRKQGSAPTGTPNPGITYSAGNTIGDAIVAYRGAGTFFQDTGLTVSTTYYYSGFSYNGSGSTSNYLTTSPLTGSQTTQAAQPPTVSVSAASLTFSNIVAGANSAPQSYSVSGNNLSAPIIITPPADFQISFSQNSGYISNPSTLTLTPAGGSVGITTVYTRFSPSSASGSTGGVVSHTSTGAASITMSVTGTAIAAEPTVQSSLIILNTEPSGLQLSFNGGNGGNRIVIARQGSAVNFTPTDGAAISGVNSNFTSAPDLGNGNKAVYDGTGNAVTVSGLTNNTLYYFAVYEYNAGTSNSQNYLSTNPGTGNVTTQSTVGGYIWVGTTKDFQVASNWSPARTTPASTDILNFNRGVLDSVTNMPTQTIAQLIVSGSSTVVLSATAGRTLTIAGGTGTDLLVAAGSSLTMSGTSACTLVCAAGTTGSLSGTLAFSGAAGHRLFVTDTVSVVFQSGSTFSQSSGATGNAFGNANLRTVVFSTGSTFISASGANPFGASAPNSVIVLQPGSWFKWNRSTTDLPAFSNRTYTNFEFANCTATLSSSGGVCTMDTLKVSSGSPTLNFTPGYNIKNALIVSGGASLTLGASADVNITFNGSGQGSIAGTGTLTFGSRAKLSVNTAAGLVLNRDITLRDTLFLTNGNVVLNNANLTLESTSVISGTPSLGRMIVADSTGALKRVFASNSGFTFPIGNGGMSPAYAPVTLTLNSNGGLSTATAAVNLKNSKHPENLSSVNYLNRYWTMTGTGFTAPDFSANFRYAADDVAGVESSLYGGRWDGTKWSLGLPADTAQHQFSLNGFSSFGSFTASFPDYVGGAAIVTLKAAPEGLYNAETGTLLAKDTVRFFAHAITPPYAKLDSSAALLDSVTFQGRAVFKNLTDGSYYLVFRHRNSIETWSRPGGEVLVKGAATNYDFTTDSAKAYGLNMRKIGEKWFVYSADVNQDGIVDFTDLANVDNDSYNFASGYLSTDVNGDGFVDFSDLSLTDNNSYNFIGSIKPGGKK